MAEKDKSSGIVIVSDAIPSSHNGATIVENIAINHDNVAAQKAKARKEIDRAETEHLHDDPEARRAFLSTFSAADEKRILRKVDNRLFIFIGLMFFFKQLDTTNLTTVKVLQVGESTNILKELHMTANQYTWVSTSYSFGYMFLEPFSVLLFKWMLPHRFFFRILFIWGTLLVVNAFVVNDKGFYAIRLFQGVFEAGMFPASVGHLNSWYRTEETRRPMMWFFGIMVSANFVGPLLCYGISHMNGARGLSAWKWVFILEGTATALFSFALWTWYPDYPKSPRSQSWLTKREQEFIETRLAESAPQTDDPNFSRKEVVSALKSPYLWAFLLSQTFINTGGAALTWYLPTIITSLGFTKLPYNQLLNMPPAFMSIVGILFISWIQAKAWLVRPAMIMLIVAGMIVCFILFFTLSSPAGIYAACILGSMFYYMFFPPFWSWRAGVLKGSTGTTFELGFQNGVNQISGLIAPQFFQSKYAYNRYKTSFGIAAAFIIAASATNAWAWWLTRNLEYDILRVMKKQQEARKRGELYVDDDYQVFYQRAFYKGVRNVHGKRGDEEEGQQQPGSPAETDATFAEDHRGSKQLSD